MTSLSPANHVTLQHTLRNTQSCLSSRLTCFLFITRLHQCEIYKILAMAKSKCYQSPSGSRPPKCNTSQGGLCLSCQDARAIYDQISAVKQAERRQKNRNSARLSRMKRDERFSDLLAENIALETEYEDLVNELDRINTAKSAINGAVTAKIQEMLAMPFSKPN